MVFDLFCTQAFQFLHDELVILASFFQRRQLFLRSDRLVGFFRHVLKLLSQVIDLLLEELMKLILLLVLAQEVTLHLVDLVLQGL